MLAGIQVSSLKAYLRTAQGVRESFLRLAAMGYRDAQLQWIDKSVPAEAVRDALQESGLICVSTQDRYDAATVDFARTIRENRMWGSRMVCVSGIPARYMSEGGVRAYGRELVRRTKILRDEGMILTFHPCAPEYTLFGGATGVEILMDMLPQDVQLTLDLYHVHKAGQDPIQLIKRYAGRMDMVHCKDGLFEGKERLMPVDQGKIDWPPILAACAEAGVKWAMAEQETWEADAFECMRASLEYMRKNGVQSQ